MGDVSAVSSSGNILLPQQDEVGGLSEALKKAVEKHKTEYSGDKKDRDYGDAFVMHKKRLYRYYWRHGDMARQRNQNITMATFLVCIITEKATSGLLKNC